MSRRLYWLIVAALALPLTLFASSTEIDRGVDSRSSLDRLERRSGALRVVKEPGTSFARLLVFDGQGAGYERSLSNEERAASFLAEFGAAVGVEGSLTELRRVGSRVDHLGITAMDYQQYYKGVPVRFGQLRLHFRGDGSLRVVQSRLKQGIEISARPALSRKAAADVALRAAAEGRSDMEVTIGRLSLMIVDTADFDDGSRRGYRLAYDVELVAAGSPRSIFVDAHQGTVLGEQPRSFHSRSCPEVAAALDRSVYLVDPLDPAQLVGQSCDLSVGRCVGTQGQVMCTRDADCDETCGASGGSPSCAWDEGDGCPFECDASTPNCPETHRPTLEAGVNNMIDFSDESQVMFHQVSHGIFSGWRGPATTKHGFVRRCAAGVEGGEWILFEEHTDAGRIVVCADDSSDDLIAHEWGHAYSFHQGPLGGTAESRALFESRSDAWGEILDRLNTWGTDDPDPSVKRTNGECSTYTGASGGESLTRWVMFEDAVGHPLRDMWTPNCVGDPGKMTDAEVTCGSSDPHTNSAIASHFFSLLSDGGEYNAVEVSGIGLDKAAHILWRSQSYDMADTTFGDHADNLKIACEDLRSGSGVAPIKVAYEPDCGNGVVEGNEDCDDGDAQFGDGCGGCRAEIAILEADCDQVAAAISAVEMDGPWCHPAVLAGPGDPIDPGDPASPTSASGTQDVALPFLRTEGLAKASDLRDLVIAGLPSGPSGSVTVSRWNTATDGLQTYFGIGQFGNFDLVPGEAYRVKVPDSGTLKVSGAHDPSLELTLHGPGPNSATGRHLYSPPFDAVSTTASQLLAEIGPNAVSVSRLDPSTDQLVTYTAGGQDFSLVPGIGYLIQVSSDTTFAPASYTTDAGQEDPPPNLVQNGDFDNGSQSWSFYTNASATFSVTGNDEARVQINTQGTNVQLYQHSLVLEPNTTYRLTFDGRNTGGDDVKARVIRHTSPYTDYGLTQVFNLTTQMNTFTTTFTTPDGSLEPARLMFWLAPYDTAGNDYYFDTISIVEE